MAAWAEAMNEGKNADSAGDIALQRNGFVGGDTLGARTRSTRDVEVHAMEAELLAKAEAEMTEDEREQLAMQRRHDAYVAKCRKDRSF
jgi:hypothetical protein